MNITIVCYRKAHPQEILFQLEPVLRKAGITGLDIIGMFQEKLRRKGFEVYELPEQDGDLTYLSITDEKEDPVADSRVPAAQVLRSSETIRRDDGSYQQGFRLHSRGWPAENPVENLFVPDYNGFHTGELVECRYDRNEYVWRPTGKTEKVVAPWTEYSRNDGSQPPPSTN